MLATFYQLGDFASSKVLYAARAPDFNAAVYPAGIVLPRLMIWCPVYSGGTILYTAPPPLRNIPVLR